MAIDINSSKLNMGTTKYQEDDDLVAQCEATLVTQPAMPGRRCVVRLSLCSGESFQLSGTSIVNSSDGRASMEGKALFYVRLDKAKDYRISCNENGNPVGTGPGVIGSSSMVHTVVLENGKSFQLRDFLDDGNFREFLSHIRMARESLKLDAKSPAKIILTGVPKEDFIFDADSPVIDSQERHDAASRLANWRKTNMRPTRSLDVPERNGQTPKMSSDTTYMSTSHYEREVKVENHYDTIDDDLSFSPTNTDVPPVPPRRPENLTGRLHGVSPSDAIQPYRGLREVNSCTSHDTPPRGPPRIPPPLPPFDARRQAALSEPAYMRPLPSPISTSSEEEECRVPRQTRQPGQAKPAAEAWYDCGRLLSPSAETVATWVNQQGSTGSAAGRCEQSPPLPTPPPKSRVLGALRDSPSPTLPKHRIRQGETIPRSDSPSRIGPSGKDAPRQPRGIPGAFELPALAPGKVSVGSDSSDSTDTVASNNTSRRDIATSPFQILYQSPLSSTQRDFTASRTKSESNLLNTAIPSEFSSSTRRHHTLGTAEHTQQGLIMTAQGGTVLGLVPLEISTNPNILIEFEYHVERKDGTVDVVPGQLVNGNIVPLLRPGRDSDETEWWACDVCHTPNSSKLTSCRNMWNCSQCTFENKCSTTYKCEICGTRK